MRTEHYKCPVYFEKYWTLTYLYSMSKGVGIADYVRVKVSRLPKGFVFTYDVVLGEVTNREAVIKALNRLVEKGVIKKLSRGKYYKPEVTVYGSVLPVQAQIVKDLMESNGKVIGYLTGYSVYNELGLTTQVSNTIQIGSNDVRPAFKRDRYTISFIQQKNPINKRNIPMLQVLDSIRYIREIPDASIESSCKRLLIIISNLDIDKAKSLVRLAMKYPPATRALLGALLEQLESAVELEPLRRSLNPITTYRLPGAVKALPTVTNWNIV